MNNRFLYNNFDSKYLNNIDFDIFGCTNNCNCKDSICKKVIKCTRKCTTITINDTPTNVISGELTLRWISK